MAQTIEVKVGDLHAGFHTQLVEIVGEQYEEAVRDEMESFIHDNYREVERMQEQQNSADENSDIELEDE